MQPGGAWGYMGARETRCDICEPHPCSSHFWLQFWDMKSTTMWNHTRSGGKKVNSIPRNLLTTGGCPLLCKTFLKAPKLRKVQKKWRLEHHGATLVLVFFASMLLKIHHSFCIYSLIYFISLAIMLAIISLNIALHHFLSLFISFHIHHFLSLFISLFISSPVNVKQFSQVPFVPYACGFIYIPLLSMLQSVETFQSTL